MNKQRNKELLECRLHSSKKKFGHTEEDRLELICAKHYHPMEKIFCFSIF